MSAPPPLPASLGPVLEFMRSLWSLDHALSQRSRAVGTRFGITATQRLVVRIVGQSPGSSAGAISGILHVHPSTLTPVLQQLVSRGLIRRAADPADRRRAVLRLTTRGERIDAASAADIDDRVRAALGRLAASEVIHARHVIDALAEELGEQPGARTRRNKGNARKRRTRGSSVTSLPARAAEELETAPESASSRSSSS